MPTMPICTNFATYTLITDHPSKKWISDHFGGAWQEVFPHAPGAGTPTSVIAHGSLQKVAQKGGSLLLIKGP